MNPDHSPEGLSEAPRQAFEAYPRLAGWIEKLANRRIEGFSHASWCAFLGELNTALDAARTEGQDVAREGWKLVPTEPTEAMVAALSNGAASWNERIARDYRAMIAAAPTAPPNKPD